MPEPGPPCGGIEHVAIDAVVIATLQAAQVIILESFLSFLGLGVQPPTPAWGNMLGEGACTC